MAKGELSYLEAQNDVDDYTLSPSENKQKYKVSTHAMRRVVKDAQACRAYGFRHSEAVGRRMPKA